MLLTVLAFAGLAIKALRTGDGPGDDPWDAQTVEWTTTSPAPLENYAELPVISSAEPALDRKSSEQPALERTASEQPA